MNKKLTPFLVLAFLNILVIALGIDTLARFLQPLQLPSLFIPFLLAYRYFNLWLVLALLLFWMTDMVFLFEAGEDLFNISMILSGLAHLICLKFAAEGIGKLKLKKLFRTSFPLVFLFTVYFLFAILDVMIPAISGNILLCWAYVGVMSLFVILSIFRFYTNPDQPSLWIIIAAVSSAASDILIAFNSFLLETTFFSIAAFLAECISYYFILRYTLDYKLTKSYKDKVLFTGQNIN
ncbi:lysoplasmalogenase family protein [Sungkyunkwania multivorans]|uniref:Lysoplasmalogenase family protein n=1 Tax=Sungkyunkwania multivorans TaxID=1173618 RepID=A0ABW3CYG4_9FLAO